MKNKELTTRTLIQALMEGDMDAPIKLIADFTFMGVTISAEVPLKEAEIGFGKASIYFSGDFTKAKAEVLVDDESNGETKAGPQTAKADAEKDNPNKDTPPNQEADFSK